MPDYSIHTFHRKNMAFETHIDQHRVLMDAGVKSGGADSGPSPKKLLLGALAGCTGIDVVFLLQKNSPIDYRIEFLP